jgi:hypothetical protein
MKIFGIGLSRTGTTSLTAALQVLGYSAVHNPKTIGEIQDHDAATDTVIATGYKFLDLMFPDSKFILTVRNETDWAVSMVQYWKKHMVAQDMFHEQLHRGLYGLPHIQSIECLLERYRQHNDEASHYFSGYWGAGRFLRLYTGERMGWKELCTFLGKPVPDVPYPHLNRLAT